MAPKQQRVDFAFVPITIGEGGGDWEGIFKFGLEVRGGALKTKQGDFETTSGETKKDKDGVVEAKTWEDEAIRKC